MRTTKVIYFSCLDRPERMFLVQPKVTKPATLSYNSILLNTPSAVNTINEKEIRVTSNSSSFEKPLYNIQLKFFILCFCIMNGFLMSKQK